MAQTRGAREATAGRGGEEPRERCDRVAEDGSGAAAIGREDLGEVSHELCVSPPGLQEWRGYSWTRTKTPEGRVRKAGIDADPSQAG